MNPATYRRMTLAQMMPLAWETTRELTNGNMVIPRGTRVKVTDKHSGLSLTADPCSHCGVQVRISRVEPSAVEQVTT